MAPSTRYAATQQNLAGHLADFSLLQLQPAQVTQLLTERPETIELNIPLASNRNLDLMLVAVQPLTDDFVLAAIDGEDVTPVNYTPGLYYRGIVKGNPESWAAISVFDNEVMGVIATKDDGNITLGQMQNGVPGEHILYRSMDQLDPLNFSCGTAPSRMTEDGLLDFQTQASTTPDSRANRCVRIYFECDYDLYVERGSNLTNVGNWVSGIFNTVATIYANEGITVQNSSTAAYTSPDGYPTSSTSDALYAFRSRRTSFNGDLAHLLSRGAPTGGGIAFLGGLCNSYSYAYSYLYSYYSNFPTYSWTTYVITHEVGHNLSSPHTQSCSWPVGAIDNCFTPEGSCSPGPSPINGGTIMSYCHLTSDGINFYNGFGFYPSNAINNYVNASTCTPYCPSAPSISQDDPMHKLAAPEAPVALYPNPVREVLHLTGISGEEQIEIVDVRGSTVMVRSGLNELNVQELESGMYFVRISGHPTLRFVKQ